MDPGEDKTRGDREDGEAQKSYPLPIVIIARIEIYHLSRAACFWSTVIFPLECSALPPQSMHNF